MMMDSLRRRTGCRRRPRRPAASDRRRAHRLARRSAPRARMHTWRSISCSDLFERLKWLTAVKVSEERTYVFLVKFQAEMLGSTRMLDFLVSRNLVSSRVAQGRNDLDLTRLPALGRLLTQWTTWSRVMTFSP